jgi:hypothetical protein
MMVVLILSLLGAMLLNLAVQESVNAAARRDAEIAQHLADAAADFVMAWFHDGQYVPPSAGVLVAKRNRTATGTASFLDPTGRSQFVGTVDHPDFVMSAADLSDAPTLLHGLQGFGTVQEIKLYGPTRPGLLCTVETSVTVSSNPPVRQSVMMQLAALEVPALQAAVQVGQHLGVAQSGNESMVAVHWGGLKVGQDLVVKSVTDLPSKTAVAPITGRSYDEMSQREDRWMEAWIGGLVSITQPPSPEAQATSLPANIHVQQAPVPGITLDRWSYGDLKRIAKQHGTYFAIDREGLLYPGGLIEPGRGVSPDEALQSRTHGDQRGLIFIDTLDQTAPRADNLGTIAIRASYVEGLIVMQGHVVFAPAGSGASLSVLSPPQTDRDGVTARSTVQLSGIHLNGLVYAAGNIAVSGKARVFGAVTAEGTIMSGSVGGTMEVWYNHDFGQGRYKGLPVVYRAPGTWMTRY